MRLVLLGFLILSIGASAETALERKSRLQQELHKAMSYIVPTRDSDSEIEGWKNRFGADLNQKEIQAMRFAIKLSDCRWQEPPGETMVTPPSCGQAIVKQCTGFAHCKGHLAFTVDSHCFVKQKANCPSAKKCALQSDFTMNDSKYGGITLTTQWMEGVIKDVD